MRLVVISSIGAALVGALLFGALPACAQVIGGESTYEDNFVHTPPPEEPKGSDKKAASPGAVHVAPESASETPRRD